MHLVATVNGDEQVVPTPTPPPAIAGEPVPALGTFGTVAMALILVGIGILLMRRRT